MEFFKAEPDWKLLPAGTPAAIRKLLRMCLQKEHKQRLHDMADVRIEIDRVTAGPPLTAFFLSLPPAENAMELQDRGKLTATRPRVFPPS